MGLKIALIGDLGRQHSSGDMRFFSHEISKSIRPFAEVATLDHTESTICPQEVITENIAQSILDTDPQDDKTYHHSLWAGTAEESTITSSFVKTLQCYYLRYYL